MFQMYPDVDPTAMIWQPDSGLLNMVILTEGGESTTPVASPAVDDAIEATPAVN